MEFKESEYLQLSGLQHFSFCRRQWALIHLEKQWAENLLTTEGNLLHERVHDESIRDKRGDIITVRGMMISSRTLGVSGQCDVLEYHKSANGIPLAGYDGFWQPYPIEYKRGKPKLDESDALQVCAQALCLEEMLCCDIPEGAIFYGEPRKREIIPFTNELRQHVKDSLTEMHQYYSRGYTPKVKPTKACKSCSLNEICMPKLLRIRSASEYVKSAYMEDI